MIVEQDMLRRIAGLQFAMWDLHLFLDTHPNNCEAAKKLEDYRTRTAALVKEFETKYGPINETPQNTSRWAWISNPWPWEKEDN